MAPGRADLRGRPHGIPERRRPGGEGHTGRERNFPTDSRQEASEGVSVTHPGVVEDFREAQRIHQEVSGSRDQNGPALEKVRQAIQKYRSVYERLTRE
ncbi:MAG TPA: hypothetical protein VFH16_13395 [Rubrobacter sp.]|nr:hypothetical protein [Rubrobacter sp.]